MRLLVPGYDFASSRAAVALARRHPGFIHAAVGVHPHYAGSASDADWDELETLASRPGVVAIGEMGLDFHRNLSPRGAQLEALIRQLDLAARRGRPVVVHDREAHAEITHALLTWRGPVTRRVKGVLHCFSGDAEMALALAEAGYLISFALPVSFSSARGQRAAAAQLPPGAFLVETDAPYLARSSAERNEPTTALRVAAELARIRGVDVGTIVDNVTAAYAALIDG